MISRASGVRPMAAATNLTYTHIYSSFGPSIVPPWFQSEHRIEVKLSTQYRLMEQTVMLIAACRQVRYSDLSYTNGRSQAHHLGVYLSTSETRNIHFRASRDSNLWPSLQDTSQDCTPTPRQQGTNLAKHQHDHFQRIRRLIMKLLCKGSRRSVTPTEMHDNLYW